MFTDRGPGVDLIETAGREAADLIVLDCMSLGALHAAEGAGMRRVVLMHTYRRYLTHSWSRGPIGLLARLKGQNPTRLWNSADLVLVATERSLDPAEEGTLPASVRYVGVVQPTPSPEASAATGGGRARILVSLSTIYYSGQDSALQRIMDGLSDLPVDAIVTTGATVDPDQLRAPGNVELHRNLPHADVMPQVDLVIGHGGHATTMRALAHDLPILIMPMHPMLDQKMIGHSIHAAGAGRVLPRTAAPSQIATAVKQLLEPGAHTSAAARLGARLRAADGATTAANHICALLPTSELGKHRG